MTLFSSDAVVGYSVAPISFFATAVDLSSLRAQFGSQPSEVSAQVVALQQQQNAFREDVRDKLANGVALAGATDMIRPAAGTSNRFGGQIADYDGRAALAFSYMHQSGHFDVGVAGGVADGSAMGKLGAGVSW